MKYRCVTTCTPPNNKISLRCRNINSSIFYPAQYNSEDNNIYCIVPEDTPEGTVLYDPNFEYTQEKKKKHLSIIDKLLPLWIILAMVVGVLIGYYVPNVSSTINVVDISGVSLPIALGLWLMMLPVLTKVQYELLPVFLIQPEVIKQFAISFVLNWIIGPLLMTGLAWACVPDLEKFRNGVIMVGLARCIAMVLIWNELASGNTELCAVMVAFNSILQIILYTPFSMFYLNVVSHSSIYVEFWPVAKSVLIFLGVPLLAGIIIRYIVIIFKGKIWFTDTFMKFFGPVALISLVYTIIIMFASQGENMVNQIGNVARVAVPMFFYFIIMFFSSLLISWKLKSVYPYAVTQAFTASSNNFELAIAISLATFGVQSNEALAASVGPLIEVPVLLTFVYVVLWIKKRHWDDKDDKLKANSVVLVEIPEIK